MEKNKSLVRKIVVDDCVQCPLNVKCKMFNSLTKKQKFIITCGVGVGKFIHKKCPLPSNI